MLSVIASCFNDDPVAYFLALGGMALLFGTVLGIAYLLDNR